MQAKYNSSELSIINEFVIRKFVSILTVDTAIHNCGAH